MCDVVHRQRRRRGLPLEGVDVDAVVDPGQLCLDAMRGVLEYEAPRSVRRIR